MLTLVTSGADFFFFSLNRACGTPCFFFFNFQDSLRVDLIFIFSPFADYYGRSEVIPEKTNCRIAALRGTGNSQQRTAGVVI